MGKCGSVSLSGERDCLQVPSFRTKRGLVVVEER